VVIVLLVVRVPTVDGGARAYHALRKIVFASLAAILSR